jgi:hypothetical protein
MHTDVGPFRWRVARVNVIAPPGVRINVRTPARHRIWAAWHVTLRLQLLRDFFRSPALERIRP